MKKIECPKAALRNTLRGEGLLKVLLILSLMTVSPSFSEEANIDLSHLIYGEGSNVKYFEWNNGVLEPVAAPTEGSNTIEYRYDMNMLQNRVDNPVNNDFGDISGTFQDGAFVSEGVAIKNAGVIGNIKADFVNNIIINEASTSKHGGAI